jgi:hypothetical protein
MTSKIIKINQPLRRVETRGIFALELFGMIFHLSIFRLSCAKAIKLGKNKKLIYRFIKIYNRCLNSINIVIR